MTVSQEEDGQKSQGEDEPPGGRPRVPPAGDQVHDLGGQGEGDEQQDGGHHPGGEQRLQAAEKPRDAEQGEEKAPGGYGAVDGGGGNLPAGDDPDEQDGGRPGNEGKPVSPEDLAEQGTGGDETQLLHVEDLSPGARRVKPRRRSGR